MEILGLFCTPDTVDVVQLVRTSDCGSEGRGFESHLPPHTEKADPAKRRGKPYFLRATKACFWKRIKKIRLIPVFTGAAFSDCSSSPGIAIERRENGNPCTSDSAFSVCSSSHRDRH